MAFADHPDTAEPGRCARWRFCIPTDVAPPHEYKMLSDRLQQITSSARGQRIWLAERHLFDSAGAQDLVDHSRDELVALCHWIEQNFTAKNRPTAAYRRELAARGLWD